ncbi:hypothetical protein [Wolbachia endosymbiont of Mansonella perstans]|uniref:hypothetical protein n=1 Tax=Wolbachia endosymbiont of Mansonella perstans TaxID=229526 RepID=UPI001CE1F06A|nr:hypothetical protein [Wolbachia endosymbiont of Mansonella perstans]
MKGWIPRIRNLISHNCSISQGGIISPVLANFTLDGIEKLLESRFGKLGSKKEIKSEME